MDPLPKKKKGEEGSGDVGWESGGTKKTKTNKKAPVPLTFPGFSPKVAEMFAQCHEAGIISKGDLDERVMEDLKVLPERGLPPPPLLAQHDLVRLSSGKCSADLVVE